MDFRSQIVLMILHHLNGERTIHGGFHLLVGKKTSQTIQDARLFRLERFFSTMKGMSRQQYDQCIKKLIQLDKLFLLEEDNYTLSNEGVEDVQNFLRNGNIPTHINGLMYHSVSQQFWERFSLFVQVLSNVISNNKKFIPIIINEQASFWVKKFFPHKDDERQQIASQLYKECYELLNTMSEKEATIFMMRISGTNRIGFTISQAASELQMDETEASFLFQSAIHYIVGSVISEKHKFPRLASFIEADKKHLSMTKTSRETYKLLQLGKSLEQVMIIRKLKRSTIEDHLVEIVSLEADFPLEDYVTVMEQEMIVKAIEKAGTKRLKDVKQNLNEDISYFKIRLVLAKGGISN